MSGKSPARLGRYELLEVLGRGAMGVVYKAHDSFLDRVVAVKTYRQDVTMSDEVRRRFEREVKTASCLQHPNIVTVYDGGLEGDIPFLAMEFVEGTTLARELERRAPLPLGEALRLLEQLTEGLAYAHAQGVVHRDLKPANILISKSGLAKIADFGVAKVITPETAATTRPVGTPSCMSPEQVEGRPVDARADVFALGVLAYQLLAGRKPFEGETTAAVLFQILNVEPKPPSEIRPELPRAVDAVIARALAKDPDRRTRDVSTFAREIRAALAGPRDEPALVLDAASREGGPSGGLPRIAAEDSSHGGEEPHLPLDPRDLEAIRVLAPEPSGGSRVLRRWIAAVVVVGALAFVALLYVGTSAPPAPQAPPDRAVATPQPAATPLGTPAASPNLVPTAPATVAAPRPARRPSPRPAPSPAAAPTPPPVPTEAAASVAPPAVAPRPTPAVEVATVDVISTPPRAEVVVNGEPRGPTPLRLSDLAPGRYDFEVRKEGYVSYRRTAELEGRTHYEMTVTLAPVLNSLRVLSDPPGAQVKVNGEPRGRTPLVLGELPSGRYEIEASFEGAPPKRHTVELREGRLEEVRFSFEPGS